MAVYVALFGEDNYEWPDCLRRSTVATPNEVGDYALWLAGDREGYIARRMKQLTVAGKQPPRAVASRWFDLKTIVSQSIGDTWIHSDGVRLWWTRTNEEPPEYVEKVEPVGRKRHVMICHKPCEPWRSTNLKGAGLFWDALHPKARDILTTPATIRELKGPNGAYAMALIRGDDLSPWHGLPDWQAKAANTLAKAQAGKSVKTGGIVYDGFSKAAYRMAMTAFETAAQANGQIVPKTMKLKDVCFPSTQALEAHVKDLCTMQEHLCAITQLPLVYVDSDGDPEMFASLDRIDSSGHYAKGNLQVVCRFINRWKGASEDAEFRRLVGMLMG
ncbi:hypothetical protein KTN05_15765 [Paracoccus sp. Z118]|uniref:hypothetical protein n=1 Tax=Paracoccus sp. Z118 TaxID=2851017 RepID=UPI001C2BA94E|nr:hypothetical protein [Paracoccus sp. Z118]MBV0893271.1 hypothetical protein [Paracoccus sp. Z118]